MKALLTHLQRIWNNKELRKRILFTIFGIAVFRLLAQITIPGADLAALRQLFDRNQALGAFSVLTGGSAENFSIILMGVSPYINASIIMQLMTVISPKLEALSKEGAEGQRLINKYSRYLTLPLALLQSYGMIHLLNKGAQTPIIADIYNPLVILPIMLTVCAGSLLLMWLGEVMTEYGIGNGVSMIIFISIIASIPTGLAQNLGLAVYDLSKLIPLIGLLVATFALTVFVIVMTEAQRNIPIAYAGRGVRGPAQQSVLPIRVNQGGMIPIIFAVSVMMFPTVLSQFFINAKSDWLRAVANTLSTQMASTSWLYILIELLLVVGFTFFYVSITFNPVQVAENVQRRGGFIAGVRPGKETAEYLGKVSSRLSLWGGLFLGFVAVFPFIVQKFFTNMNLGSVVLLISGAGLIIVVGVVLELVRQINAQLVMHDYDKLY